MIFLVQTFDGIIKHDFSFALNESKAYHKWMNNEFEIIFTHDVSEEPKFCIPIGSVEFVINYLEKNYGLKPKPRNVPEELFKFAGRNIFNGTEKDINLLKFVKSNDNIKSFTEICDKAPIGYYQISDIIDIESEWRAFIYQGKLVGLNNYSGEFDIFPDMKVVKSMIENYKSAPVSYTLDVAISNGNTVIIEVHDFFSCGLYGFNNHKILPYMFSRWFHEFISKK